MDFKYLSSPTANGGGGGTQGGASDGIEIPAITVQPALTIPPVSSPPSSPPSVAPSAVRIQTYAAARISCVTQFDDLVSLHFFQCLGYDDLAMLGAVCKRWGRLSLRSVLWQGLWDVKPEVFLGDSFARLAVVPASVHARDYNGDLTDRTRSTCVVSVVC